MEPYASIKNVYPREPGTNRIVDDWFSEPVFAYLYDAPWDVTEKLDGTNIRIILDEVGGYEVRGRTDKADVQSPLFDHCLHLEEKVRTVFEDGRSICLYGEGVGPRIQKGGERYGDHQHFRLFDVKVGRTWLSRDQVREIADLVGIPTAPYVGQMTLGEAIRRWRTPDTEPPRSMIFDGTPEGWVLRPLGDLLDRHGNPIRVKIKERDFQVLRQR